MERQTRTRRHPGLAALPLAAVNVGFRTIGGGARRIGFNRGFGLAVNGLRRSGIYRPFAIIFAVIVLPSLSWLESGAGMDGTSAGHSRQVRRSRSGDAIRRLPTPS